MIHSVHFGRSSFVMTKLPERSSTQRLKFGSTPPEVSPPNSEDNTLSGQVVSKEQHGLFAQVKNVALNALGSSVLAGKVVFQKVKAKIPRFIFMDKDKALIQASMDGNERVVEKLLKLPNIDVNAKNSYGRTALMLASKGGYEKLVEMLLKHPNIDINAKDNCAGTALTWASLKGHETVVEMLLRQPGIEINAQDKEGNTALILASLKGYETVVEKLLKEPNIEINAKDEYGFTALTLALRDRQKAVVDRLLSEPHIDINAKHDNGTTALMLASKEGYETVVETLLKDPNIEINAKDNNGLTALILASKGGHEMVVEKLLKDPNIEINAKDNIGLSALEWASRGGHETLVEKFLNHPNIDINGKYNNGLTALAWASFYGHGTVVENLLKNSNVDINAKDKNGNTALILASNGVHETIVDKLLNQPNIDINAKDNDGHTALDRALIKGFESVYPKSVSVFEKLLLHPTLQLSPGARQKLTSKLLMLKHLNDSAPSNPSTMAFVSLLPDLLLNHPIRLYQDSIFSKIERFFDAHPAERNFHPNEAELLLMIKHPDLWDRNPFETRALTRCLTSISHFVDIQAALTDETLKTWGDIGFLTHGFRFWRYDTLGGSQSLLSQFGFKPAPDSRPFNEVFGKGFLFQDQASGSLVEFRRGYLLVTHPEKGTLVIRNSSPVFGRDLLRHPAYYLKKALTPDELLTFDPRTLSDQDSILYREHYPNEDNSDSYSAKSISALTNTLLEINTRYRKFKLDTEAFENGSFTGHLSPGLPKLVYVLNQLKAQGKPLPDLAFTQPEFPPYQPYFYLDADMKKTDRFPLTPSHLQELNDFVSGDWSEKKYLESDWIRFLTQAGVENRGELVMLEPKP